MGIRNIISFIIGRWIIDLWLWASFKLHIEGDFDKARGSSKSEFFIANNSGLTGMFILRGLLGPDLGFVVQRQVYDRIGFKFLLRLIGLKMVGFGIDDTSDKTVKTLAWISRQLEKGTKICIFGGPGIVKCPDIDKITELLAKVSGSSNSFKARPVYVGGTREELNYYNCWPAEQSGLTGSGRDNISVCMGRKVGFDDGGFEKNQVTSELLTAHYMQLKKRRRPLIEYFYRTARKFADRLCVSDGNSSKDKSLTYKQCFYSSSVLAGKLRDIARDQQNIGVILPGSVAGAIVNISIAMLGKTVVNLNYALNSSWDFAAEKTNLKVIITSKKFTQKLSIADDKGRIVFVEDLLNEISIWDKTRAAVKWQMLKFGIVNHCKNFNPETTASIIFSSGSTSTPKGIMLSHGNIVSNIEQLARVFKINKDEKLCSPLPIFHSFGLVVGLWLPLICGASVCYLANPLDAVALGRAVERAKSTVLIATPTFLLSYIRRITPEQFKSLRRVFAGAEKLKDTTFKQFYSKFKIKVQQGYGLTELSPVVSVNPEDDVAIGKGCKASTAGIIIPGTTAKIVSLEDGEILSCQQRGLIKLKGPSVMEGYYKDKQATEKVLIDSWYDTGDIGYIDEDRYLTIVDRLSRFSKIGGEMVSHTFVEEKITEKLTYTGSQAIVVTAVADSKKSELIAVVYDKNKVTADILKKAINQSDLPNICKPRLGNCIPVEAIAFLASGKVDILAVKKLAQAAIST